VVDDFFNELMELFPEETKIKVHYNLFQTMCKTNIKKPCTDFMLGSIAYLEQIAMRDENFFLSDDKPSLLSSMNIEKLWPIISENSKTAIWNYIKSFFTIGIKIIEMPVETVPLINYIIGN
jgi:hypothetical protein